MNDNTLEYLGEQMGLFAGGYQHVQLTLTAHLTGSGTTVPIGLVVRDHPTGELLAMQVPVIVGDLRNVEEMSLQIVKALEEIRAMLIPF